MKEMRQADLQREGLFALAPRPLLLLPSQLCLSPVVVGPDMQSQFAPCGEAVHAHRPARREVGAHVAQADRSYRQLHVPGDHGEHIPEVHIGPYAYLEGGEGGGGEDGEVDGAWRKTLCRPLEQMRAAVWRPLRGLEGEGGGVGGMEGHVGGGGGMWLLMRRCGGMEGL